MRDFVGHHPGQLGLGLRGQDGAGVDPDVAAEHSKRIDLPVADREEMKITRRIGTGCDQTLPQATQVFVDLGIVDIRRLVQPDVVHDALADLLFQLRRQVGAPDSPRSGRLSANDGFASPSVTLSRTHRALRETLRETSSSCGPGNDPSGMRWLGQMAGTCSWCYDTAVQNRSAPALSAGPANISMPENDFPVDSTASPLTHFDGDGQAHMVDVAARTRPIASPAPPGASSCSPPRSHWSQPVPRKGRRHRHSTHRRDPGCEANIGPDSALPSDCFDRVAAEFVLDEASHAVHCEVTAECTGRTGVEMEALTATSIALLTIYDMLKRSTAACASKMSVARKTGGKSGRWIANNAQETPAR